jgi:putative SOS response-associated peptidase YedK
MCGRVRLASDYSEIKIRLKFDAAAPAPNFAPDYNKPPTRPILTAVRDEAGRRVPKMMKWGLIPSWARDERMVYSTFNARSEEFTSKVSFKDAWRQGQRCLVVTDGFYEWQKLDPKGKNKQPYAIAMAAGGNMIMAGLWSRWFNPVAKEEIVSCTIMTTSSNEAMKPLHNRMPVILYDADWPAWLGETPAPPDDLLSLLRPCPDEWLKTWPVSKDVGNVANNRPDLWEPIQL